jgi:hypothetical protein
VAGLMARVGCQPIIGIECLKRSNCRLDFRFGFELNLQGRLVTWKFGK